VRTIISTYFWFNRESSITHGLSNIRLDTGMIAEPYWGSRDLITDKIAGKDINFLYKVDRKPIQFELTFSLLEGLWTPEKRFEIARWLIQDDYCEFYTADAPDRIFYAICIDKGDLLTNGLEQGYVTLRFKNLYPYAMTSVYLQTFDLYNISSPIIIEIENKSNVDKYYYPEIEIQATNTNITLQNLSDSGRQSIITGFDVSGETIYINSKNKKIISDVSTSNPLSKFNKNWFRLTYGVNRIQVTGKCKLSIRSQFPIYI